MSSWSHSLTSQRTTQASKICRPGGTVAYIKQVLKIPGDLTRILVEGKYRAQITEMIQTAPYLRGHIESIPDTAYPKTSVRGSGADAGGLSAFEQYEELVPKLLPEYLLQIMASQNPAISPTLSHKIRPFTIRTSSRCWSSATR